MPEQQRDVPSSRGDAPPRMSLRVRLTLWVVVIFSLIHLGTQGVFWLYEQASVERVFVSELQARAAAVASELSGALPDVTPENLARIARREQSFPFSSVVIEVFDESGNRIVERPSGGGLPWDALDIDAPPPDGSPAFRRLAPDAVRTVDARARSLPTVIFGVTSRQGPRYAVAVATSDAYAQQRLDVLTHVAIVSSIIGALASAVSGWFIAGMAVAPIERLRGLAERLRPESIGERLEIERSNTEIARLTQELDLARQRIQAAFIAQERFLSNVSHEIKTPIAVMLTEAQTMDQAGCPPAVAAFVRSVQEEMMRLGRLVESFLTLTRIRDGKGLANLRTYNANDLAMDSIENCGMMADQYRVRLVPYLLADDDSIDASLFGDPDLLRTMLDNLIRNAIRFSPEHGVVEIRLEHVNDHVIITVRDDGPGIPPERLQTIFDRFAQAHDRERKGRGHGLGLAIAQGIAELHRGGVTAANRPEGGCDFTVRIPAAPPGARTPAPKTAATTRGE